MMRRNGFLLMVFLFALGGCSGCTGCSNNTKKGKNNNAQQAKLINFNISFLLDLSDRINPSLNPKQSERDQEVIMAVEEYFKKHVSNKSARALKDKMRVIFHPRPESENISQFAEALSINFDENNVDKEKMYNDLNSIYKKNIDNIYKAATNREEYEGSDIWRFMKDDVRQKTIINKPNYRNILVILTDGYMYWPYDKRNNKNKYNYITGRYKHFNQFRNPNTNLLYTKFEEEDFGFIPVQDSLQNLEILVVGVNSPKNYPEDLDIIKKYWGKWFDEMNVKGYLILKADLPNDTKQAVNTFLSN